MFNNRPISWPIATWVPVLVPALVIWSTASVGDDSLTATALLWAAIGLVLTLVPRPRWAGVGLGLLGGGLLTALVSATLIRAQW